ncbi:MAG: hypothetical protein ACLQPV_01705 [Vulcanimicrobiaceae bacterium]
MNAIVKASAALLSFALAVGTACAAGAQSQAPPVPLYKAFDSGAKSTDRGTMDGTVVSIDYAAGTLVLKTGKGESHVAILPSTSIYEHDQYATLADIKKGSSLSIDVNEVDGRLIAQIIHVK